MEKQFFANKLGGYTDMNPMMKIHIKLQLFDEY